jgi:hypothetical protein
MTNLRQSAQPMQYEMTRRMDNVSGITSGPAGVVIPVTYAPLLRNDSASGRITFDMELAEMPKPLQNAVIARGQAWFVPRPSLPQFVGVDDYVHSYQGKTPTALGSTPVLPSLFDTVASGSIAAAQSSELFKALGVSLRASTAINTDLIDSFIHVYNFRKAAHSSKMANEDYYAENATTSLELKPAFWPRNRMSRIVPDYEQALVQGSLELDVTAGQVPISGIAFGNDSASPWTGLRETSNGSNQTWNDGLRVAATEQVMTGTYPHVYFEGDDANNQPEINAEMANVTITASLADIDKARTTQAFAKARAAYAGSDFSGYNTDDVLTAELMSGFNVPASLQNRPWLLDSKTVVFGMTERHATDAANLDDSMSTGRAQMALSINIPRADYGGMMVATVEVMPERLYERQEDPYLLVTDVSDLPEPQKDLLNTNPVDSVPNARIDTGHTSPTGVYGYEPLNDKWQREFTRLGGEFRQLTPGTPSTAARTALWQVDYVDPAYTSDAWLCKHPFPQSVFSAPSNDIVNIAFNQQITIVGTTQFGDALVEDNDEHADQLALQP